MSSGALTDELSFLRSKARRLASLNIEEFEADLNEVFLLLNKARTIEHLVSGGQAGASEGWAAIANLRGRAEQLLAEVERAAAQRYAGQVKRGPAPQGYVQTTKPGKTVFSGVERRPTPGLGGGNPLASLAKAVPGGGGLARQAVRKVTIRSQIFPEVVINDPLAGGPGGQQPASVESSGGGLAAWFLNLAKIGVYVDTPAGEVPVEAWGAPTQNYFPVIVAGAGLLTLGVGWGILKAFLGRRGAA